MPVRACRRAVRRDAGILLLRLGGRGQLRLRCGRAGPGRVTTVRDDGDVCDVDMYFGSPSDGRFATHCAGGGADDLWFGGRWFVGDGAAGTAFCLGDELPGVPASGKDVAGVEVAAANSVPAIGPDDLQVLLVSADGGDYRPGDWLEPKDGGNQRMMIVSAGQSGSVAASNRPLRFHSLNGPAPAAPVPQYYTQRGGILGNLKTSVGLGPYTLSGTGLSPAVRPGAVVPASTEAELLPLIVVCMQKDHDIPTRGARYFSAAKSADGPIQSCQKKCLLYESANIQRCVWACEQEGG